MRSTSNKIYLITLIHNQIYMSLTVVHLIKAHWLELAAITAVSVLNLLYWLEVISLPVLLLGMLFGLYPLAKTAVLDLIHEHKVGTELFITIAVIISILGQEYVAGALVLVIILIAEFIASVSTERARASIRDLIGEVPQTAIRKKNDTEEVVAISALQVGDVVLVRAGDKIPVDGTVCFGDGAVNQAPITGESIPKEKEKGSEVYAGTILESGALDVTVTKLAENTVFARIIALVEQAEEREPQIQKFTDKVASWLIPVVFIFISVVFYYTGDVKLIIALLIFTSPAELGLATPLVTISAIARAAREGILVKGGLYLEALAKVDTVVFDKTGTLTVGMPSVSRVEVLSAEYSQNKIVMLAASADRRSGHPLANAVISYAEKINVGVPEPTAFEVVRGRGVRATVEKINVLVGNKAFLEENAITIPSVATDGAETVVYVAANGITIGALHISDAIREGAREMIQGLRASGVENIHLFTGDSEETAQKIGSQLGIEHIEANMLPEDKIRRILELQEAGSKVAMVGDGINDAPALTAAHVGISMGVTGTAAAMEAADIVLMKDDLSRIARARAISRKAYRTIQENIFVGVGVVHIVGITLVLMGIIGPIQAAAIHLLPDFLVFLNSTKLLKVKIS